jgi:hypothetical protein
VPFWQTPGGAPTHLLPTLTVLIAMGLLVAVSGAIVPNFANRGCANFGQIGAPGWTRTSGHLLRRQVLYPPELRAR